MDDYRRTKYCPELDNVRKKKEHIKNKIKEEHPRAQDMHTYISNNSGSLKKEFMKIYNDKCAYCGVSNDLLPKNYFEVDHFLYEKAPLFKSKKDAGYIENLVLACHDCNHNKSSFYINSEQYKNLYPDQEGIKKTFVRDKKYYICVNTKASESYIDVTFKYNDTQWDGWVPVEYRRTGVNISDGETDELYRYLNSIYDQMNPKNYRVWLQKEDARWSHSRSVETKEIFNLLKDGKWHCRNCEINNPNFARRIQDLKEMGYTIATHLNYHCPKCGNNRSTRLLLLPIDRVELAGNGYETWSPALRKRILRLFNYIDAYEGTVNRNCLPDHKFSEIRWDDDTKSENPDTMTDDEIREKFQLLTNQRNQQKREVCRKCFQTGKRGSIYGIDFYYEGGRFWESTIPTKGKAAEEGCIGCPWYDIERWRKELMRKLEGEKND